MSPELAGKIITTTVVALVFALGGWIYSRYFKTPVVDYSSVQADLGEDSPVIEGLLSLREAALQQGDHIKALEYSSKALERCPDSSRIRLLHERDMVNASKV